MPRCHHGRGDLSYLARRGLEISALAYYENNLHPNEQVRAEIHRHLRSCIDAAKLLGCSYVGTFVGRDWNLLGEREREDWRK